VRGKFALVAAGLVAGLALAQPGPALSVDAQAARHSISPDIYGLNWWWDGEADFNNRPPTNPNVAAAAADLRVGVRRWGGNNMSRYNWRLDVWNIDADWFFEVLPDNNPRPDLLPDGSRFNGFLEYTRLTGSKLMGTIPLLEWLPKARQRMCSFSVLKYGPQQSVDPYWTDCGNGVGSGGTNIVNDPSDAAAQFDASYQRDWVAYVVSKYGRADQGGVAFWSLDNEPVWWSSTHRDVHPLPQRYDETASLGLAYAAAIKAADPTALVAGPVSPGWGAYFFSNADFQAGWSSGGSYWSNPTDRNAHGGVDFSSWYLQQFKQYEDQNGRRLLDYFDLNGYNLIPDDLDSMTAAQRLQSTRVFWDPSYLSQSSYWNVDDQGQPARPRLIPRMHDWVNQNYPGTKIAVTEYIWGALNTMNGALAQADILGIFGREGLDLATLWGTLRTTDPGAFAFRIYRNYDGIGGAFGETSVQATTGNPDQLSIFAAQRSDTALTILVLNKTSGELSSTINISNFTPDAQAQVWQYSQANLTSILGPANVAVTGNAITATFPAYSMTLFIVPASANVLPVPKPVITDVTSAASYQRRIAPGQMVIVWGRNLGPAQLDNIVVAGPNGVVNTEMDGVRILFDGIPAPMIYVWVNQCAAVVPYLAALKSTTHVQVEYQGVRSDPFDIAVSPTGPGLFTVNMEGTGQAAMQNQDGVTPNSTNAPAAPGSVVVLWLTGGGVTNPPGVDGRLETSIHPLPVASCSAEIGGRPAVVEYCAQSQYVGLFQVNARIDPAVAPGDAVQVKVTLGGASSQDGATIVVR
jgi:uncharacterized protein (TIGR03437 family)